MKASSLFQEGDVPVLLEFKLVGEKNDTVKDIRRRVIEALKKEHPEVADNFTIRKTCINGTLTLPDNVRLFPVIGHGKYLFTCSGPLHYEFESRNFAIGNLHGS